MRFIGKGEEEGRFMARYDKRPDQGASSSGGRILSHGVREQRSLRGHADDCGEHGIGGVGGVLRRLFEQLFMN